MSRDVSPSPPARPAPLNGPMSGRLRVREASTGAARRVRPASLIAVATAASLLAAGVGIGAGAAAASTPKPSAPTGIRLVSTSRSGFTVTLNRAAHATSYRVYTSTVKADLYQSAISKQTNRRTLAVASSPRVTLAGLSYTTSPYWYRVLATNSRGSTWSNVSSRGALLTPAVPTSPSIVTGSRGAPVLSWNSGPATGYTVQQSAQSNFSGSVRSYVSHGPSTELTPFDLQRGTTYYLRVRALNGPTASSFSSAVSTTPSNTQQDLKVLTYNVRSANLPNDEAPWSQRRPGVIRSVRSVMPDVFGTQESGAYVSGKTREVDSIASGLSGYRVVDTDLADNGQVLHGSGNHIVYRRSSVSLVGSGGRWNLGHSHDAAYQAFRTPAGARFIFVSTHLATGTGKTGESQRGSEAATLLRKAHAYGQKMGIASIMYVGDFNSYYGRWHSVDTPGNAMRSAGVTDSKLVALHLYNSQYSSINHYTRIAPTGGHASDHVYVEPGIGVRSWGEVLNVSKGRFVGVIPSDHNAVWTSVTLPI